jgi:hypothetical protein
MASADGEEDSIPPLFLFCSSCLGTFRARAIPTARLYSLFATTRAGRALRRHNIAETSSCKHCAATYVFFIGRCFLKPQQRPAGCINMTCCSRDALKPCAGVATFESQPGYRPASLRASAVFRSHS